MAVPARTVLSDGDDMEVAPVNTNFSNIVTELNGNLDNTNWSSASADKLAGSKVDLSSNDEFTTEHDSTSFTHKILSNGAVALQIKTNNDVAANVISQIDVDADDVVLAARSGSGKILATSTTTGASGVDLTVSLASNGALGIADGGDDGRETALYYIWLVADSSGTDTPDLTCVLSKESTASTTFWTDIDDHVMTGGAADYATLVGAVYNSSDDEISGMPRPIGGGSFRSKFVPEWTLGVTGTYAGNNADARWIGVGFDPDFIILRGNGNTNVIIFKTSDMAAATAYPATAAAGTNDYIVGLGWNGTTNWGFQVNNNLHTNQTGVTYYWAAYRSHNVADPRA
jgi:hypothetical protein